MTSAPDLPVTGAWGKADIVNHLAAVHGYREYLELCTANTGGFYAAVDRSRLHCRRLMYRCPDAYDDGMVVDFRSGDLDIAPCLREVQSRGLRFDAVFVDPWHEYGTTRRDLEAAFDLVVDGGAVVVHDCNPPRAEIATPEVSPLGWCGVTYRAYLDFVTARDDLTYFTVDTDYGVGVIRKRRTESSTDAETTALVQGLQRIGDDFEAAFRFFQDHRRRLLDLRTVEQFLSMERPSGAPPSPTAHSTKS